MDKVKTMNRYFIVNYLCATEEGDKMQGVISIIMEDGRYINRRDTEERITTMMLDEEGMKVGVVLENIIELNEQDYLDWYA